MPAFHLAPVLLDPPSEIDAADNTASAHSPAHQQLVPADRAGLRTKGLTVQAIESAQRAHALSAPKAQADGSAAPMATSSSVSTYTPAQIRAAYGLPALPATGVTPTAEQAAQLGAGQTIYIVDASHDANAAAELAAFNKNFGLPACTTKAIAATASLPLAAPATTEGCSLSVVYSTPAGGMTTKVPAYDSGWATEIALDVQWAHATAPLARIVLIEAATASNSELLGGVMLANAMGPGPVSMSFGAYEGSYTTSADPAFTGVGMTYLAATGDWGAMVSWPSVSTYVLAVGGTRLNWSGSGARTESGWTGTGGGTSAYVATPSYQTNKVPGLGTPVRRVVADVAFNADPASGQYTAVMSPGSSTVNWVSTGGTSLSTPQWAGLIAVANAMRAQGGKAALGSVHALLYGQIGTVPGTYASTFADITSGSNGTCATCTAKVGHDLLTGLGTPNAGDLLRILVSNGNAATAPVVTAATINGLVGTALASKVSVNASNPVSMTLTGAPSGMTINGDGLLGWPKPVAGSYAVTVTAKDNVTGLTGKGVVTVKIETPVLPPVVTPASITGRVGTAVSYKLTVTAQNAVTYSLTGAPSGLTIAGTGTLTWAKPVQGNYTFVVIAKDSKNGLSGQSEVKLNIEPVPVAPSVGSDNIAGKAGTALSFTVKLSTSHAVSLSLAGQPSGMTISGDGLVSWLKPVAGSYTVKVTAKDSVTGLSGTGTYTVKIEALPVAPVVTSASVSGKAGTALTFTIAVKSTNGATLAVEGKPDGMVISSAGAVSWAKPVAGTYTIIVTATDNKNGLSGKGTVSVTIARVPVAPVLASTALTGVAGRALTGTISITDDPQSRSLNITIGGVPAGMVLTPDGKSFHIAWAYPVKGNYTLAITARNSFGLITTLGVPVTIAAR